MGKTVESAPVCENEGPLVEVEETKIKPLFEGSGQGQQKSR